MERRKATRSVLLDGAGRVAFLKVQKLDYYKIPGGGVDAGEELVTAAKREVMEEAGCACEIVAELGALETELPGWGMLDESTGFLMKVVGEKRAPRYDDFERERGFGLIWVENLAEAIRLLEGHRVEDAEAARLQRRDLKFLKKAREVLSK